MSIILTAGKAKELNVSLASVPATVTGAIKELNVATGGKTAIAGKYVYLDGVRSSGVSDLLGLFIIENITPGYYSVISVDGYRDSPVNLTLTAGQIKDLGSVEMVLETAEFVIELSHLNVEPPVFTAGTPIQISCTAMLQIAPVGEEVSRTVALTVNGEVIDSQQVTLVRVDIWPAGTTVTFTYTPPTPGFYDIEIDGLSMTVEAFPPEVPSEITIEQTPITIVYDIYPEIEYCLTHPGTQNWISCDEEHIIRYEKYLVNTGIELTNVSLELTAGSTTRYDVVCQKCGYVMPWWTHEAEVFIEDWIEAQAEEQNEHPGSDRLVAVKTCPICLTWNIYNETAIPALQPVAVIAPVEYLNARTSVSRSPSSGWSLGCAIYPEPLPPRTQYGGRPGDIAGFEIEDLSSGGIDLADINLGPFGESRFERGPIPSGEYILLFRARYSYYDGDIYRTSTMREWTAGNIIVARA